MALHFGDHFWGDGGYESIEARLGESYKSVQALTGFFQDYVAAEAKHAMKLEKLLKKHTTGVNELTTIQAVWTALSNDTQRYIDVVKGREAKIKSDVIAKLGVVTTETSNSKRTAMNEAQKQLKEWRGLNVELAKTRDAYVKASIKSRDSADQLRQMTAASEKPSKIKPKEKEVSDNDAAAKKADQAYKEAQQKVAQAQPQFVQKLNQLYNEVQNQEQIRMHGVVQVLLAYLETNKPLETFVKDSDANVMASIKRVDIEKDVNSWIQSNKKETEPPGIPQYYAYDAPEPTPMRGSSVKTTSTPSTDRKVNFNETPMTTSFKGDAPSSAITSPAASGAGSSPVPASTIPSQGSSGGFAGARPSGNTAAPPVVGGPPSRGPPPVVGGPPSAGAGNDLILRLDDSMAVPDDEDIPPPSSAASAAPAPTPVPSGPKLPPGARPLFGPAVVIPKKDNTAVPAEPRAVAGTPPGGRGAFVPASGGPNAGRGRGGAPPPVSGGPPTSGAPPTTGRGRGVALVQATPERKQSTGSFFKELAASVDDFGGDDPNSLDSGLGALNATQFDDIDVGPASGAGAGAYIGWAKAVFDYDAGDDDELGFKEGQMVHLLAKDDSGWWSGELDGKVGLFPANYVEEV